MLDPYLSKHFKNTLKEYFYFQKFFFFYLKMKIEIFALCPSSSGGIIILNSRPSKFSSNPYRQIVQVVYFIIVFFSTVSIFILRNTFFLKNSKFAVRIHLITKYQCHITLELRRYVREADKGGGDKLLIYWKSLIM